MAEADRTRLAGIMAALECDSDDFDFGPWYELQERDLNDLLLTVEPFVQGTAVDFVRRAIGEGVDVNTAVAYASAGFMLGLSVGHAYGRST